jgi:uncharacterized membrane protein YhaH (DUF805 family)
MFKNPFSPEGSIGRTAYALSWCLFFAAVYLIDAVVQSSVKETGFVLFLVFPPIYIIAQGAKRCHDMGHSGWRQFIPFYIIWMLFAGSSKRTAVSRLRFPGTHNTRQSLDPFTA